MPRRGPYIPRVSIIIPTCNRPELLRKCVEACLALDYAAGQVDVVVVEDGWEAATGPGVQDPRASVLRQPNAGPACARSLGIARAGGEFVVFTDDDCRPDRDWLRQLVQVHRRRPGALLGGHTRNACQSIRIPRQASCSSILCISSSRRRRAGSVSSRATTWRVQGKR